MTIDTARIPESRWTREGDDAFMQRARRKQVRPREIVGRQLKAFTRAVRSSALGTLVGLGSAAHANPVDVGTAQNRWIHELNQSYLQDIATHEAQERENKANGVKPDPKDPDKYLVYEQVNKLQNTLAKKMMAGQNEGTLRLLRDEEVYGAGQALSDASSQGADTGKQAAEKVLGVAASAAAGRFFDPYGYAKDEAFANNLNVEAPNGYDDNS